MRRLESKLAIRVARWQWQWAKLTRRPHKAVEWFMSIDCPKCGRVSYSHSRMPGAPEFPPRAGMHQFHADGCPNRKEAAA